MSEPIIRGYQPADEAGVVSVWNESMVADPIHEVTWRGKVLLDPNFDPEGCLVAEIDGVVLGFLLSVVRRVPFFGQGLEPEDAWITAFGVEPAFQRRGIGSALLETALDRLRSLGRSIVTVSPYVPNYFIPGVDVDAYSSGVALLEKHRFDVVSRPLSMRAELTAFQSPKSIEDRLASLREQGFDVQIAEPSDIVPVLDFIPRHFTWDWHREAASVFADLFTGDPRTVGMIVATMNGEVVGYAQHRSERFGPFGVHPDLRGQGIGRVLLAKTLTEMLKKQFHAAWFLWTSDDAARLYQQLGFHEVRRFAVMQQSL